MSSAISPISNTFDIIVLTEYCDLDFCDTFLNTLKIDSFDIIVLAEYCDRNEDEHMAAQVRSFDIIVLAECRKSSER